MRQYTPLTVTVPASTPASSPVSSSWRLYPGWLHSIRVSIPAGHVNLTGVRVLYQGTVVVPFALNSWLIGDNDSYEVPFEDEVMDRGIIVQAYNTDRHPHTFNLYADIDPELPGAAAGIRTLRGTVTQRRVLNRVRSLAR